jgi:WD40 repeat protein
VVTWFCSLVSLQQGAFARFHRTLLRAALHANLLRLRFFEIGGPLKAHPSAPTLLPVSYGVTCLSVLPDGRVVSGSYDKTPRVWQPATGVCERVLVGHTGSVTCLCVLPDGRVVSGSYDKTPRVWQPATGVCVRVLEGHTSGVTCLSVLPDGRVVSGSSDKTLCVWQPQAATGVCECVTVIHENSANFRALHWHWHRDNYSASLAGRAHRAHWHWHWHRVN